MPVAVEALRTFLQEYSIKYVTPLSDYKTEEQVKYRLLDFGVSTKSLEAVSIFADTFTTPSAEQVRDYIQKKLPICRSYIAQNCDETIMVTSK
jgi:hypothetical protein